MILEKEIICSEFHIYPDFFPGDISYTLLWSWGIRTKRKVSVLPDRIAGLDSGMPK